MIVSPILSGVLLTFATIEAIFFIDVITALLAILIILLFIKENVKLKRAKILIKLNQPILGI
jgi:DHA3 family macrolide efflux protein-like MFS transporter